MVRGEVINLERHEATDGIPAKSVIRFFDKIPHNHYYSAITVFRQEPRTKSPRQLDEDIAFPVEVEVGIDRAFA